MHLTLAGARGALLLLITVIVTPTRAAAQAAACTGDCSLTPDQIRTATLRIAGAEQEFEAATRRFAVILTSIAADANATRAAIDSIAGALARWDLEIAALEKMSEPRRTPNVLLALGRAYAHRHRLDAALRDFGEAVRTDPRRADAHMLSALVHLAAGRGGDAIAVLRTASDLDVENPVPYYLLARVHRSLGHDSEARDALETFRGRAERLVASSGRAGATQRFEELGLLPADEDAIPRFVPAVFAEGFALFAQGQYEEAVARLRGATALRSSALEQVLTLGRSAIVNGDMASALKHLADAVSRAPDRAEPHRLLAAVYAADGQYDHSIQEFTAAVAVDPTDERSWAALVETLATVGRFDQAEQALRQANQLIPRSGQLHFSLGRLYQSLGRYPEAAREFEAALDLRPLTGEDTLVETLGGVYATLAAFDRAEETWRKRIDVHPNDASGHRRLGEALLKQDRDAEALAEYWCALFIDPRSAADFAAIAQLDLRLGRYEEAADASRRALELDLTLKEARYIHGTALMHLGRTKEGAEELKEFQRLQAEATAKEVQISTLERLKRDASVSLASGDYEKAAVALRDAVRREPAAATYLALGFALMAAGHHDEAVVNIQKSLQIEPAPDAHRYLAESFKAMGRLDDSRAETEIYRQSIQQLKRQKLAQIAGLSN